MNTRASPADALWRLVRDDLAALDQVCRPELAALPPNPQQAHLMRLFSSGFLV